MPLTLSKPSAQDIIVRLLTGRNYRDVVNALINDSFLQDGLAFLRDVAIAKFDEKKIDEDWYKSRLLVDNFDKDYFATNAGTNTKTIYNARHTTRKSVVIEASLENYQRMQAIAADLAALCADEEVDFTLSIKVGKVSVELTLTETIIVVNALAVKRAAIAGGFWSTAGKRVEKPLMETFCSLFSVPQKHFSVKSKDVGKKATFKREIDFYLVADNGEEKKCEVKLMGSGNSESADAVIARGSALFVADKLSQNTNKPQLDSLGVAWVELYGDDRFQRFAAALDKFGIPHAKSPNTSKAAIAKAASKALSK